MSALPMMGSKHTVSVGALICRPGLNVAKGFALPLVRPDSKDTFGKLKDSEPGSWSIHGGKLTFASDSSPVRVC